MRREYPKSALTYQRIEYLESTGTQYIQLPAPQTPYNQTIDAAYTQLQTDECISGYYGIDRNGYGISLGIEASSNGYFRAAWIYEDGFEWMDICERDTNRHTFKTNYISSVSDIYVDNYHEEAEDYRWCKPGLCWLPIFAKGDYNRQTMQPCIGSYAHAKLYSYKLWEKQGSTIVLVYDFLPVRRSDGVLGLLNSVDGSFHENTGTGVFLAGPDVGHWLFDGGSVITFDNGDRILL